MRTTINLDDQLLKQAKIAAASTGRTFTKVVEDALRDSLGRQSKMPRGKRIKLPVSKMTGGLQPGVDLYDSASLLDLMERADANS